MKLENLEEFRTIVVMPGRFQPFHNGHKKAFQWLKNRFEEVYIATSDKIDLPKSPFSFDEKVEMIMATGIPEEVVVKTQSPYRAVEVTENFNPGSTVLVYAVSQKDMTGENPRFTFEPKRDGSLSYMQPFQTEGLRPILEHAYVLVMPVFEFEVLGEPVISATQIREKFIESNTSNRIKIIEDLYGEFNEDIFEIFERKLKIADAVVESIEVDNLNIHNKFINGIRDKFPFLKFSKITKIKTGLYKGKTVITLSSDKNFKGGWDHANSNESGIVLWFNDTLKEAEIVDFGLTTINRGNGRKIIDYLLLSYPTTNFKVNDDSNGFWEKMTKHTSRISIM